MAAHKWELLKLIRAPKIVQTIRVSTFASYYWCAVQSWLKSLGHQSPYKEAMGRGRRIHQEVRDARKDSEWEKAFLEELDGFFEDRNGDRVLSRNWKDTEIIGEFVTHDIDELKVNPDRTVVLIEYKTKKSRYIRPIDLAPAVFQAKMYAWLLEPYMNIMNYRIIKGVVVFLNTKGKPIGQSEEIFFDYFEIEEDIERILYQFNNPEALIPPQKWKCNICDDVFKSRCPFQGAKLP